MTDIRTIEIVTPDIQRQSLIDANNRLRDFSILLFSALIIAIAVCTINYIDQEQKNQK
jgi:hypothetical protein